MTDDVVIEADTVVVEEAVIEEKKVPTSFKDLRKAELVAAAHVFGTETEGNVNELRADLEDSGVTWKMYADAFLKKEEPVEESNVVTSADVTNVKEEEVVTQAAPVTVEPELALAPQAKYLIKMTRQNPSFEFRRFKFTQEQPYAIMSAQDAQDILSREEGFRQAYPAELQEFYS